LVEWRLAGKPKYSEEACPSATLSTTYPTWPDPDSNPGRLSYGAASSHVTLLQNISLTSTEEYRSQSSS
jgi:hypothetical protein